MATRLTLDIDPAVVAAARKYAEANGTSLSKLVEAWLAAITRSASGCQATPQLSRWRGSMSGVDIDDHKEWLAQKAAGRD